jgi:hypothetical protein
MESSVRQGEGCHHSSWQVGSRGRETQGDQVKKEKEKKAKAEAAEKKKKSDASSHKDPPRDEVGREKKKRNKKSKESSGKVGGKDAAVGVGMFHGEWVGLSAAHEPKGLNRSKRDLGERVGHSAALGPKGLDRGERVGHSAALGSFDHNNNLKKFYNASPSTPSETSANIPSDDDGQEFLNGWDEWSEHEVGNGPRAKSSLGEHAVRLQHWEGHHTCCCCANGSYLK